MSDFFNLLVYNFRGFEEGSAAALSFSNLSSCNYKLEVLWSRWIRRIFCRHHNHLTGGLWLAATARR